MRLKIDAVRLEKQPAGRQIKPAAHTLSTEEVICRPIVDQFLVGKRRPIPNLSALVFDEPGHAEAEEKSSDGGTDYWSIDAVGEEGGEYPQEETKGEPSAEDVGKEPGR